MRVHLAGSATSFVEMRQSGHGGFGYSVRGVCLRPCARLSARSSGPPSSACADGCRFLHRGMTSTSQRSRPREVTRVAKISAGILLMIVGPLVGGPLPGPLGFIGFGAGLALVLQSSRRARRQYARAKKRWPSTGRLVDKCLRWRREWARMKRERANRRIARRADTA